MTIFCPNGHPNPDTNRFCQSCGMEIVPPNPHPATIIQTIANEMTAGIVLGDRYRIQREIGRGGFGRTYLCEDVNRFNELCVLKEFAPQAQGTALLNKAQELFEREAGVMYRLQHPQIPRFREMFRSNRNGVGQLFLVQDYIGGETYQQLLRQKLQEGRRFSETEITEFLTKILPVLTYIHSLGVIHRDISPDNLIKRTMDGLPVLIDFGGVKQVAVNLATQYLPNNEHSNNMATRLGKIGYAPSEQMQRGIVSPQSDLYALAATSLVLLTGLEPADLIDPQNFGWNWREHIRLTPQLNSVFDRMLQFRPSDRFSSAQDVLEALSSKTFGNFAPTISAPLPATVLPPTPVVEPIAPPPTVVAVPRQDRSPQPEQAYFNPPLPAEPGLADALGKTWLVLLSCVAALGLGWGAASLTGKNVNQPTPFESGEPAPITSPTPTQTISPTPTASPTISPTPSSISIDALKPFFPAALASRGINADLYGNIIKQIFGTQNPNVRSIPVGDNKVQSQLDSISTDFGSKLNSYLSGNAIGKIGTYSATDRANWRSQVNGLNLSERALVDLTDAKYRSITDLSTQKLGISFDEFVSTPLGQVYLATMSDRVSAIQDRRAIGSISIPLGSTSGVVRGTLQPGEGKAFLGSLTGGQDISIRVNTSQPTTKLSIYPPTSKLPAILESALTSNWFGRTTMTGAHEFVLVSHSDLPVQYEITLTAVDPNPLKSNQKSQPTPIPTPQN